MASTALVMLMAPLSACMTPPVLFTDKFWLTWEATSWASCELILMLPRLAVIVPELTMLPIAELKFTFCAAEIVAWLTIDPPADMVKLPALVILPALTMSLMALRLRLRLAAKLLKPDTPPAGKAELNAAPARLNMLAAVKLAVSTPAADDPK